MAPDRVRCHCEAARALPLGLRGSLGIEGKFAVNGHWGDRNNKGVAPCNKKEDDTLGIETYTCDTDEGGSMEIISYAGVVFSRLRGMFGVTVRSGCIEFGIAPHHSHSVPPPRRTSSFWILFPSDCHLLNFRQIQRAHRGSSSVLMEST